MRHITLSQWPPADIVRPRRSRLSVSAAAAAAAAGAAAANPGGGARPASQQPSDSHQPQRLEHSHQSRQWSPGFGRLLWQELSPDWWKLLCVAAFTFVSVIATVSVGPAVGRGPWPGIASRCRIPALLSLARSMHDDPNCILWVPSCHHRNHHMSVAAVIDVLTVPASTPRTLYTALGWLGAAMLGSCVGLTGQARCPSPAPSRTGMRLHASCHCAVQDCMTARRTFAPFQIVLYLLLAPSLAIRPSLSFSHSAQQMLRRLPYRS